MDPDTSNTIFRQAIAFVTQTNKSLFLTGKAGTGKTTFLKYIQEHSVKKTAVVAPTGVAAIHAGGVTMHSFFQLPLGMYLPSYPSAWGGSDGPVFNKHQLLDKLRLSGKKRELIREMELLIMDEVSMLRADLLDAIDTVLRSVRRRHDEPFGGVQMLYIGDLFQLPPVVKNAELELFHEAYDSPYFFAAKVFQEAPPLYLELKKIYRQRDDHFIQILNHVRGNCCEEEDWLQLHRYYRPGYRPPREEGYITLTSHNHKADAINRQELESLPGKTCSFEAELSGEFPDNAFPVSRMLQLKEGAQIMFMKNDKGEARRYYNGKIGIVQKIEKKTNQIFVAFPQEEGVVELTAETWHNIRYQYHAESDEIVEEVLGSFTQFPVRLAWAVTIHKSQGLTFEKAVIDAGASFAPGQVYVALSRLTTLEGLILHSAIQPRNVLTDEQVIAFSRQEKPAEVLDALFSQARRDYLRQSLLDAFDWNKPMEKIGKLVPEAARQSFADKRSEMAKLNGIKGSLLHQHEVAGKFQTQLDQLLTRPDALARAHERTTMAAGWFKDALEMCTATLTEHIQKINKKSKTKKYVKSCQELLLALARKQQQIMQAAEATAALQQPKEASEIMDQVTAMLRPRQVSLPEEVLPPAKPAKGETFRITLDMFRQGVSIDEIALARNLKRGTVEAHLGRFVASGEVDIQALVAPEKLQTIVEFLDTHLQVAATTIREALGNSYSYAEIKAAVSYWQRQHSSEDR